MEWCVSSVSRGEMQQVGKSWLLSVDREYMRHIGCMARLVIAGWALELYR